MLRLRTGVGSADTHVPVDGYNVTVSNGSSSSSYDQELGVPLGPGSLTTKAYYVNNNTTCAITLEVALYDPQIGSMMPTGHSLTLGPGSGVASFLGGPLALAGSDLVALRVAFAGCDDVDQAIFNVVFEVG